jgi:hypothetical protein
MTSMEQWLGSRGGVDTGEIMAILSVTQDKLAQALSILQILAPKLDDIYNGQVSLRQNVADLLVGAGIPDSVAAQVDALLLAAQLDQSKVNAALALLGSPLPPPSTGGTNPPPPPATPTITLAVNVLAGTAPGSIQFAPTVVDPDNQVVKVECYLGTTLVSTKAAPGPYGYTLSGVAQGTYVCTEKLYYLGSATPITSNAVQVTINPATQTGPVLVDPIT